MAKPNARQIILYPALEKQELRAKRARRDLMKSVVGTSLRDNRSRVLDGTPNSQQVTRSNHTRIGRRSRPVVARRGRVTKSHIVPASVSPGRPVLRRRPSIPVQKTELHGTAPYR